MDEHALIAEILAMVSKLIADQRRARAAAPKPAPPRVRKSAKRRG